MTFADALKKLELALSANMLNTAQCKAFTDRLQHGWTDNEFQNHKLLKQITSLVNALGSNPNPPSGAPTQIQFKKAA